MCVRARCTHSLFRSLFSSFLFALFLAIKTKQTSILLAHEMGWIVCHRSSACFIPWILSFIHYPNGVHLTCVYMCIGCVPGVLINWPQHWPLNLWDGVDYVYTKFMFSYIGVMSDRHNLSFFGANKILPVKVCVCGFKSNQNKTSGNEMK